MIATLCLYGLISISESVSVKFSTLYLILRILENSGNSLPLVMYMITCVLTGTTVIGLAVMYVCTYEMYNTHTYYTIETDYHTC